MLSTTLICSVHIEHIPALQRNITSCIKWVAETSYFYTYSPGKQSTLYLGRLSRFSRSNFPCMLQSSCSTFMHSLYLKQLFLCSLCFFTLHPSSVNYVMTVVLLNFVLTGAGIYVTTSQLLYSSSSLPNNSIITSYTDSYGQYGGGTRMSFYCCSNSTTSGSTGTFIGLNGNSYSGRISIERYNYSHSYAGCIRLYLESSSYSENVLSSSEQGIYTCSMPDSAGRNIDVNVGIYQ